MRVDADALGRLGITAAMPVDLRERIAAALVHRRLPGGEWLFHEGDPGDSMFLVGSGRLEVVRRTADGPAVVATLHAGQTVGELALLEGGIRAAGVRAVRDSDLHALHRDDVMPLLADPDFAGAMLRAITRMVRHQAPPPDPAARHRVVAVVAPASEVAAALVDALAAALDREGVRTAVLRAGDVPETTPSGVVLDQLERRSDVVLLDGGAADGAWSAECARQADRVLVVVDPTTPVDALASADARPDLQGCDLLVTGPTPVGPGLLDAWDRRLSPRGHHRLRPANRRSDGERLARRLTGRAIGLVLSGGGARGLSHIGVLQGLEDAGVVVDRYGGTSMGAWVSALAATGRRAADVREVAERELVRRQPFRDWTVPTHGLIRGTRAVVMLRRVFGDLDVRHLTRSWFGVSATLADAAVVTHRDGPVWEAVGCSMSLPGLAPPRVWRGRVVVDGGVLDNLPVGIMAQDEEGPIIAADVTRQPAFGGDVPGGAGAGAVAVVPRIVETLAATMGLTSRQVGERSRGLARVLVEPDVAAIDLLDFAQLERAAEAGLVATRRALGDGGLAALRPRG